MEEIELGNSLDYFDKKNSFALKGYFSSSPGSKSVVIFQPDIFSTGNNAFAVKLAESLRDAGISMVSFDNVGSGGFGGKSEGEVRDYLPDQMIQDIYQVVTAVNDDPRFAQMRIVLAGFSYGCIPVVGSLIGTTDLIDGIILLSSPEKGSEVYERLYKGKTTEEKSQLDEKLWKVRERDGRILDLSGLFFNEKRSAWNILPIIEAVFSATTSTGVPSRLIYAGADEVFEAPRVKSEDPFVIISDARHDFSNKWNELVDHVADFVSKV